MLLLLLSREFHSSAMYSDTYFFLCSLINSAVLLHFGPHITGLLSCSSSVRRAKTDMDRLNAIINDLILANEFDLILPVVKAGLLTLVRDTYLSQFLLTIEQISSQQVHTYHLAFVHFNRQLVEIETYLKTLAQTLHTQYHLQLFNIEEFMAQLPYNAVKQQLLHTTNIIKATFYTKFIDIFEHYLAAYGAQHARIACAELLKGLWSGCAAMYLHSTFVSCRYNGVLVL